MTIQHTRHVFTIICLSKRTASLKKEEAAKARGKSCELHRNSRKQREAKAYPSRGYTGSGTARFLPKCATADEREGGERSSYGAPITRGQEATIQETHLTALQTLLG